MRRLPRLPFDLRPLLPGVALALLGGALADILTPLLPLLPVLALLTGTALVATVLLRRAGRGAPWMRRILPSGTVLFAGLTLFSLAQQLDGSSRGVLARHFDVPALLQDAMVGAPAPSPRETAELRSALAGAEAPLRPRPATADEYLYNALLLHAREEPVRAARALAEALRREATPRPDALLLHAALTGTGLPGVLEHLAEPPAGLYPVAQAQLAAMRLPPAERAAALAALLAQHPDQLTAAIGFARAALAAAQPEQPTVATARRIVAALRAFENPDLAQPFAARFLDPGAATRLAAELRGFAPVHEIAERRIAIAAFAPPPGMPNAPMLLRVAPPEAARNVQFLRARDAAGEVWADIPQRTDDTREAARDPVPTLRLMRPFRATEFRFRYTDRDGVVSEPLTWQFDPVPAVRETAQRTLQRLGPFAHYQPGHVGPNRLNALPIAAQFRAGLSAIEWHTDAERQVRVARIGIPDAAVLSGEAGRTMVEIAAPASARTLFLTAVYADGTRSPPTELAIR
jgi:hypothetical protein